MILASVERTPPALGYVGGVLKRTSEPVVVLVEPRREGATLSCEWLFTHPGLIPGPYELEDGTTVQVPPAHCATEGRASHTVTLEVTSE